MHPNNDESHGLEPLAIVGMGCRWPGDLTEPSELWDFLTANKDAYEQFPADRLNVEAFYHETQGRPGSFNSKDGCFIKSPYAFDPSMFGINPQEVMTMDPSQRKILEVVYESLESAGASIEDVSGSSTGCFVSNFNQDHQMMQLRDPEYPQPYGLTGSSLSILSNRVSYCFNLKGPSMTLDTACSSSFYALHMACSAIRNGDCDTAIVAGSNLILTPETQIVSSELGTVSASGRCHTFDTKADGYVRAEGVAALYVKRLDEAITNRDPIRAILRSSAINANGKTGGITRPSSDGQESVMRKAYERAAISFSATSYLECHGTGTPVGDPLEVAAVGRVFSSCRDARDPLLIGSVKTNLGHGEAVSGLLGVMKVTLALENDFIPATVGLENLNPRIDLKDGSLKIVTQNTRWPQRDERIASVNSFGFGGSNGHVILESADSYFHRVYGSRNLSYPLPEIRSSISVENGTSQHPRIPNGHAAYDMCNGTKELNGIHQQSKLTNGHATQDKYHDTEVMDDDAMSSSPANGPADHHKYLLTFSAHNKRTLEANVEAIGKASRRYNIVDLCHTMSSRRSNLHERCYFVADNGSLKVNDGFQVQASKRVVNTEVPRLAFVFSGQGTQWSRMGIDLAQRFKICRDTIQELNGYIKDLDDPPTWTLQEKIMAQSQDIDSAEIAQPLITCIQIMIVNLLQREIAAAYAAQLISAQEAIALAYLRGSCLHRNQNEGAMLAVPLGELDFRPRTKDYNRGAVIACYNSPKNITVSGDKEAISRIQVELEKENIFARLLKTGGNAYHSPHMSTVGPEYEAAIRRNCPRLMSDKFRHSKSLFFSTVTGHQSSKRDVSASYWRSNLESPVLFDHAMAEALETSSANIILEIGPHCALRGPIHEILEANGAKASKAYFATMIRKKDSVERLLSTAGGLWMSNYPVALEVVNDPQQGLHSVQAQARVIPDLPRYQWQYDKEFSVESRWNREWRFRKYPRHDLLGSRLPGGSDNDVTWRNVLRSRDPEWLQGHCIAGRTLFPAAGYICMALEAVSQLWQDKKQSDLPEGVTYELENVTFHAALSVPDNREGVETFLTLSPSSIGDALTDTNRVSFRISSISSAKGATNSRLNCSGLLCMNREDTGPKEESTTLHVSSENQRPASYWYDQFNNIGMSYGEPFQLLKDVCSSSNSATASLVPAQQLPGESRYLIHPTVLDAALQLSIIAGIESESHRPAVTTSPIVPIKLQKLTICRNTFHEGESLDLCARSDQEVTGGICSTASISTAGKSPVLSLADLISRPLDSTSPNDGSGNIDPFSRLTWVPDIDHLGTQSISKLFPLLPLPLLENRLERLVSLQISELYDSHQQSFCTGHPVPHIQHFLDWVTEQLTLMRQGNHPSANTTMSLLPDARAAEIEQLSEELCAESAEARLICHLYNNMGSIFAEEKTGIEVATEDGRLDDLYKYGHRVTEGNRRLADIVALAALKNPNLHILEIGAGTGSATAEILDKLRSQSEREMFRKYAFTDVSPGFLQVAKDRFRETKSIEYFPLDMEEEAAVEKVKGGYDLLVASNAVHATSSIVHTLRNLRKPLKAGGKLLLLEITQTPFVAGLLLGTFSDFWKGEDDENFTRHGGPFLSKPMWQAALSQAGFSQVDFFLDDYEGRPCSTVICATAVEKVRITEAPSMTEPESFSLVYWNDPSPAASALRAHARSLGRDVNMISLSSTDQPRSKHLIFYLETERPFFPNPTGEELKRIQNLIGDAQSVLWITRGSLMRNAKPEHSMINGIVNALKIEMPFLKFSTLDLDEGTDLGPGAWLDKAWDIATRGKDARQDHLDTEFRLSGDVVYCPRIILDDALNAEQAAAQGKPDADRSASLDGGLKVQEPLFKSQFDSQSTYLLVGCLGELGRLLSRWMVMQGARHLTYLSRSGVTNEETETFISELNSQGVTTVIAKGDVASLKDVEVVVASCSHPVKGVVQGALVLKDQSFVNIDAPTWTQHLSPRVTGTWNLHQALQGQHLDFFLMWSSLTAIFGIATQSNYLATCAYMDSFARYRHSLGLPATSLSLGHIADTGNIKRNPTFADSLTRNGLYGNKHDDFLRFCDAAITPPSSSMENNRGEEPPWWYSGDPFVSAHLLAGVGPGGLRNLNSTHPLKEMSWYRDPRFSHLVKATKDLNENDSNDKAKHDGSDNDDEKGEEEGDRSVADKIRFKLAQLLFISPQDIKAENPITNYGVDSLVAAELRKWLSTSFGREVSSTMAILDSGTSVLDLEAGIVGKGSE